MGPAFGKLSETSEEDVPPADAESTSIVGRGTEMTGDLVGAGQLRVEGRVDGTIRLDGEVHVATDGSVEGRIEADEVVAAGRVSGTIAVRGAVRLEDGCQVDADVYTPVLELEEGGRLSGRVDMSGEGIPDEHAPPEGRAPSGSPTPEAAPEGHGGPGDEDVGEEQAPGGGGEDGDTLPS